MASGRWRTRRVSKKVGGGIAVALVIFILFMATPPRPAQGLPERAAEDLLRDLRFGRVASAFERLPPNGFAEGAKMREGRYRLRWWLYGRDQAAPDTIRLEYHVVRGWGPCAFAPVDHRVKNAERLALRGARRVVLTRIRTLHGRRTMKDLSPDESELRGSWLTERRRIVKDDTAERIEWLILHRLQRLASDASGWDTLFRSRTDGRLWELIHPHSEMHGGGPPLLRLISSEAARIKYGRW